MTTPEAVVQEVPVVAAPKYLHVVLPGSETDGALPLTQRVYWPCTAGQMIAEVTETAPAKSYRGQGRQDCAPLERVRVGANAEWNPLGNAVVAKVPGHIVMRDDKIWVEEKLELAEDVDAAGGVIDFAGPVFLRRNVMDLAEVRTPVDITVDGTIEAATVVAGGNITVNHGICAKEKGKVEAHGNISARFASNARLFAGGDVAIANEVANSQIACGQHFNSPRATVLSSQITAVDGIVCDVAGSGAGIRTVLEIGLRPDDAKRVRETLAQLTVLRKKSHDIRAAIEPLMKNPKALTPQQKEKATELLYLADEADSQCADLAGTLNSHSQQAEKAMSGCVEITAIAHPGVVVRCMGYETQIQTPLKGPMKIALRALGNEVNLVALDAHNHVIAQLPTVKTELCSVYSQLKNAVH